MVQVLEVSKLSVVGNKIVNQKTHTHNELINHRESGKFYVVLQNRVHPRGSSFPIGGLQSLHSHKTGFEKLAKLSSLENLDLSNNNFNNSILSTLGGLASLKSLYLSYNRLMGTIRADDLKHLKNLEKLDISNNELDSFVTHSGFQSISMLGKIKVLDLEFNQFNGSILSSLCVLSSLETINLGYNNLNGSIHFGGKSKSGLTFNNTTSMKRTKRVCKLIALGVIYTDLPIFLVNKLQPLSF